MEIKTVSIIGLGALGILYGDLLSRQMQKENLRIIANSNRIKRYKDTGIFCNNKSCDFNYITPDTTCEPADLIIFTVKYNQLKEAIVDAKNQIGPNTLIISALNGIVSEEDIGAVYGKKQLLYCVAQGMDAVKEGNRVEYKNTGILCFGELEEACSSEKVDVLAAFFDQCNIPYEIDHKMKVRLWSKFMLNVGVNQTVAVYEGDYSIIQQDGEARDLMLAAMEEVLTLAAKENIPLTKNDIEYWKKIIAKLNPEGMPSMRQDLKARRYSEVELFAGTVLKLAKRHELSMPTNLFLYTTIKEIEATYR